MANWRRITGTAGLVMGATAAGAGAVIAAERIAINRLRGRPGPAAEPFGSLRGLQLTVLAEDGVPLHVEINGPDTAPMAIIFCHGYTVNQDCWYFQRRELSEHRLVFWDQRDHGRSGRSAEGSGSIGQLGTDLKAVIDAAAPGPGPVVLVGHSMGGMTIMALADQYPDLFGTKVVGSVLIATTARGLEGGSPWMPSPNPISRVVRKARSETRRPRSTRIARLPLAAPFSTAGRARVSAGRIGAGIHGLPASRPRAAVEMRTAPTTLVPNRPGYWSARAMMVIPPMEWPTRTTGPGPGAAASITAFRSVPS